MNKDKVQNQNILGTLVNKDESGIIAYSDQIYDKKADKSLEEENVKQNERLDNVEAKDRELQSTLEGITKTGEASAASNVSYNHNDSQLDASNVQQAIDEVYSKGNTNRENDKTELEKSISDNKVAVDASIQDVYKKSNYNDGDNIIDFNTIHLITDNPEFICVAVDANDRMLYGIKTDGQPYFGVGCPQQVKDYIDKQINKILGTDDISSTIDSLKEIETFLKDFTNSDTLKKLLDLKANVDEVKATTDDIYKKSNPNDSDGNVIDTNAIVSIENNPEYIKAITDSVGRLIEAIGLDGVRKFFTGINIQGNLCYSTDNPEYIAIWTDNQNKIVFGFKTNGEPYFGYGVSSQIKEYFASEIEKTIKKCKDNIKDSENNIDKKINLGSNTYPSNINSVEDNIEYIEVKTDSQGRIFESVDFKGKRKFNCGIDLIGASISTEDNPEYTEVSIDNDNRILAARKTNGDVINNDNIDFNGKISFKNDITANGVSIYEVNNSLTETKEKVNSISNVSLNKLDVEFTEGDISDSGSDIAASNKYRTIKFTESGLYIVLFSDNIKVKYSSLDGLKRRKNFYAYSPFVVNVDKNSFTRFVAEGKNNVVSKDDLGITIYYIAHSKSTDYTITVAASDSKESDKEKADIICDGNNDTKVLAAIFNNLENNRIFLYEGNYYIKEWFTYDKTRFAIPIQQSHLNKYGENGRVASSIEVFGSTNNYWNGVVITVTKDAHDAMDTANYKYIVLGIANEDSSKIPGDSDVYTRTIALYDINIKGYYYDKAICYIDASFCQTTTIVDCNIYSIYAFSKVWSLESLPVEGVIGIRCGRGSNYGARNRIQGCIIYNCYVGISCSGEHFIFEDINVHTCWYAFVFGGYKTRGHYEHPNIMIGCSIEACYRYMILTKQGIMQEIENYTNTTEIDGITDEDRDNIRKSTIIAIGTSTESVFPFPFIKQVSSADELPSSPNKGDAYRVGPGDFWHNKLYTWDGTQWVVSAALQETKGILEMVKGFYRGRIEGDGLYAEQGSCNNMTITKY